MNTNYEKYLPLGTVVLLKNATKCLMITGFATYGKETGDKIFDYSGCFYPEGILDVNQIALFDHSDIYKIFAIGYSNDEEKKFKNNLKKALEENNKNG